MAQTDVDTRISNFLTKHVRRELAPDEDIFALGLVNSLLAVQLITFVEKEFGIAVEDEDLDLDNFRTISNIAALVEHKTSPNGTLRQ